MKIKQQKNSKKRLIIVIAVFVLALLTGGYYVFAKANTAVEEKNNTTTNTSLPENKTDQTRPYEESKKSTTNTDPQAPVTKDKESDKTVVSVVTTSSVSNGILYIRGGINNAVGSAGICFAQLTGPTGASIRKETVVLAGASTADCKTIQIPTSELSPGTWTYTLNYSSQNSEGASSEETFVIK